jgi:hypothetical protein
MWNPGPAQSHEPVRQRVAVGEELVARAGADAVSADQNRALEAAAVLGRNQDPVTAVLAVRHHRVGHQRDRAFAPAGIQQHIMEVDAVDDDIGVLEAGAERHAGRDPRHLLAIEGVEHEDGGRLIRHAHDVGRNAQLFEHVEDVGPELDAIADRTEVGRAFEHLHRDVAAGQRQRRGKPAETAADNQDGRGMGVQAMPPATGQSVPVRRSE